MVRSEVTSVSTVAIPSSRSCGRRGPKWYLKAAEDILGPYVVALGAGRAVDRDRRLPGPPRRQHLAPAGDAAPAVLRLRRGRVLAVAGVDAPRPPSLHRGLQLPAPLLPGRDVPPLQPTGRRD